MNAIMKNIAITILFFFSALISTNAQCPITLTTQAEVDAFTLDPSCDGGFIWSLNIRGADITNLDALSVLDSCGRLRITNTSLVDLSGLHNLTKVYRDSEFSGDPEVEISDNPLLENLNGLENLRTISNFTLANNLVLDNTDALNVEIFELYESWSWFRGWRIHIVNNPVLRSFTGLPGLVSASDVTIKDNPLLNDISALSNLKSCYYRSGLGNIAGSMIIENNDALTSLSVLDSIRITDKFIVADNDLLENLSGVSLEVQELTVENNNSLTEFGDFNLTLNDDWLYSPSMSITENDSLVSIGVNDFQFAFDTNTENMSVNITDNPMLSICSEDYICELYETSAQNFTIENNAIACNSVNELVLTCTDNGSDHALELDAQLISCDTILYNIDLASQELLSDSTQLRFHLLSIDSSMYQFLEIDGAIQVGDTLVWDVTDLDSFDVRTYNVMIEVNEAYGNDELVLATANLTDGTSDFVTQLYDCIGPIEVDSFAINMEYISCNLLQFNITATGFSYQGDSTELKFRLSNPQIKGFYNYVDIDGATIEQDTSVVWNIMNYDSLETFSFSITVAISQEYDVGERINAVASLGTEQEVELLEFYGVVGGDLVLNTQEQVDSSYCFEAIQGDLIIKDGLDITNLDSLANLLGINGDIYIESNPVLESIDGFNELELLSHVMVIKNNISLSSITGFNKAELLDLTIAENDSLVELSGFNNLHFVDNLFIENNNSLTDLNNFGRVGVYEKLVIKNNSSLISLDSLHSITFLGGGIDISNNESLASLNGLQNIENVSLNPAWNGIIGMTISNNASLANLDGLEGINELRGDITIEGNESLISINALDVSLLEPSTISIKNNPLLCSCSTDFICTALEDQDQNVTIEGNAGNCSTIDDVINNCNGNIVIINSQSELDSWECSVFNSLEMLIIDGSDITNLNALQTLESCDQLMIENTSLTSLVGLENLNVSAKEIVLRNNESLESLSGLESLRKISSLSLINNPNLLNTDVLNIEEVDIYLGDDGQQQRANIEVVNNESLTSITGLFGLTEASDITIKDNPSLIDLSGFSNLTEVGYQNSENIWVGDVVIENNNALESLNVFDALDVAKSFVIINNDNLEIVSNLDLQAANFLVQDNLFLIDFVDFSITLRDDNNACRSLQIINNPLLSSINLQEYEDEQSGDWNCFEIEIAGNSSLAVCHEDYICEILDLVGADSQSINISNNAEGCNDIEEVSAACSTSTADIFLENLFNIHPNPLQDQLYIQYKGAETTAFDIQLQSIEGKLLHEAWDVDLNNKSINVQHLPSGIYLLSLKSDEGCFVKKLVVE